MAAGGVDKDILIPYNIIGKQKLDRLTALARRTNLTVAADSDVTVNGLSQAAAAEGVTVGVVVELYRGRTGVVSPQQAADLGRRIDALPGLALRGVMIMPSPPDVRPLLRETLDLFDRAGLPHPIVSGGSTQCAFTAHEIPELTEHRAGEYPVGGAGHFWAGRHTVEQCALRVLTAVVSRPVDGRAILDAGSKTMSSAVREGAGGPSMGHIVEYPDARFRGASEEHGSVDVSACERKPAIGERVQVLPVHACPCVNEHDEMVAVRKGKVEAVWPILARGKIR